METETQLHARLYKENWVDLSRMVKRLISRLVDASEIELVEIRRMDTVRTRLLMGLTESPSHRQTSTDLFPAISSKETPWPQLICQIGWRNTGLWGCDAFHFDDDEHPQHSYFDAWCEAIANDLRATLKGI